jgi:DNA polymerase-2
VAGSVDAFILTAETRNEGATSSMLLYAASADGPLELLCDFHPYFFAEAHAEGALGALPGSPAVDGAVMTALSGSPVQRLAFSSLGDAERCRRFLLNSGRNVFESDVRPRERFLMDRGINGGVRVEGHMEPVAGARRCRNPKLTPMRAAVPLSVCSLDIETSVSSRQVLSIALHQRGRGAERRKVFMQGSAKDPAAADVMYFPGERALLAAFLEEFHDADPDIVIGWNVVGFDLAYLRDRAAAAKISLPLGRGHRPFFVSETAGRFTRADIPGRVVLDGPQLLRTSFYTFESYSLENVAQEVLGEGKLIGPGANRAFEIDRLFRDDKARLGEYNLKDAVLVTRIFEKLGLLDLTIRRTELSGMLLDQVGMSTAAFDHFYLPRLHAAGYVAPDVGRVGEVVPAAGGYVMDAAAGIYDDIFALDFQSLYPSIIRTFSIDPLARARADDDPVIAPSGHRFSRSHAILPRFIGELMEERRRAKKNSNAPLSQAIKILMNSFYGVMGSSGCRLYHRELPEAITSSGQWLLLESKRRLEELGHKVIYGDTDSLFVQLGARAAASDDLRRAGGELAAALTEWWKARLRREFGVESCLLLDFKKHYRKFLVPSARGAEGGAKKRYAGMSTEGGAEKVEFVGLEVVRSDWTRLAREFQLELYTKIFHGESVGDWVREYVKKVRSGAFDDKLVYRKRLHKSPDEYGKSPPPYVRAALLLKKPAREVCYVMTLRGPIPVELEPGDPDYNHYIERQLRPVANSILETLGTSFEEMVSAQVKLFP